MAPHIRRSVSSDNPTEKCRRVKQVGKRKSRSVKPQNMGAELDRPQCLFFRQTAARSLDVGHFHQDRPLIHRVTHRSCGAEPLPKDSQLRQARLAGGARRARHSKSGVACLACHACRTRESAGEGSQHSMRGELLGSASPLLG